MYQFETSCHKELYMVDVRMIATRARALRGTATIFFYSAGARMQWLTLVSFYVIF